MLFDLIVFDGVDELDVVGPLEVLRRAEALGADASTRLCSRLSTEHVTGAFGLRLRPERVFVPGQADVVVVPGGGWVARADSGAWAEVKQGHLLTLLGEAAAAGAVMAGVCTGTLILAHAGVIGPRRAATHHDAQADLASLGATVVPQRVVDDGQVVTSGGVTSGIDLALWLLSRFFGQGLADLVAEGLEYPWISPVSQDAQA